MIDLGDKYIRICPPFLTTNQNAKHLVLARRIRVKARILTTNQREKDGRLDFSEKKEKN